VFLTEKYHSIKVSNISFENEAKFKYLGMTVTEQNLIHEQIRKIKFGECLLPCSSKYSIFPAAI
jgi:hypothetical protein